MTPVTNRGILRPVPITAMNTFGKLLIQGLNDRILKKGKRPTGILS